MSKIMVRIAKIFSGAMIVSLFVTVAITTFLAGYGRGYGVGWNEAMNETQKYLSDTVSATTAPTTSSVPVARQKAISPSWGGPQLWEAVNKRRTEFGVNPMSVKEEICTIASIRLNQILELGKLDGHAGFSNMPTDRPDLKWIFEKYNLAEFLVAGAESPQEAVSLWENTLGHKELLNGGQYVWGCIYAQAGFGVAIAAY